MDGFTGLAKLEKRLRSFVPERHYEHDEFIMITLREALAAARKGNFGVGAVLVDAEGRVIQKGHNHVFHPYFRSDLHAEMDVMTKFEKRFKNVSSRKGFTLFSSLEPCPMCFTRLINCGVSRVYYAAVDREGGMAQHLSAMPEEWQKLARRQKFSLARCSPELSDIALSIFLKTVGENDRKLQNR